jgi:hypothetical protein
MESKDSGKNIHGVNQIAPKIASVAVPQIIFINETIPFLGLHTSCK